MRVLSKKTAVLVVVCLLAAVLLTGCDSGLQTSDKVTSLEINGWTLSSPEGEAAIRDKTASEVTATKNVEYTDTMYLASISGNAISVLDRVNDPLFLNNSVDYDDPSILEYLSSHEDTSCYYDGSNSVSLGLTPIEGAKMTARSGSVAIYWPISTGVSGHYNLGVLGYKVVTYARVPIQYSSTVYAYNLRAAPLWVKEGDWANYKGAGSASGITYSSSRFITSTDRVGWWRWAFFTDGLVAGMAQLDIYW